MIIFENIWNQCLTFSDFLKLPSEYKGYSLTIQDVVSVVRVKACSISFEFRGNNLLCLLSENRQLNLVVCTMFLHDMVLDNILSFVALFLPCYLTYSWRGKDIHTFPNGIGTKVNTMNSAGIWIQHAGSIFCYIMWILAKISVREWEFF